MSKLQDLINELYPHGVEYKCIGDICTLSAGGDVPKGRFSKEMTEQYHIPIYSNGIGDNALYGYTDIAKINVPCVTIAARGTIGYCALRTSPFFPVIRLICAIPNTQINIGYLKYAIEILNIKVPVTGIPQLTVPMLSKYKIPVPPIERQNEIVNILDRFSDVKTNLVNRLKQELEHKRKIYEYSRDKLLTFNDDVDCKSIVDITEINRGVRVIRKQLAIEGNYPVYQNSLTPLGYYDKSNCPANTTYVICAGAAGEIGYSTVDFWAADDCTYFTCQENLYSRYLYYVLLSKQSYILSRVRRASIPRLPKYEIEKIKIPVPPVAEQERIVATLDKLTEAYNAVTDGIQKEIEQIEKIYTYCTDKLLTFKKA